MPEYAVNPNRVYYNFHGALPPVQPEAEPVPLIEPELDDLPKLLTDTTLRDGAQDSRFALFPHEARLKYFDLLHKLDNGTGRIYALEVFIYQKRDLWVLEKMFERGYEFPKVTTWTRATPKDIKLVLDVSQGRIEETGMLASCSDHHIFDKLGFRSKEEAVEKYLQPIMTAYENGIRPRVHLEDCTKADIYGWVIPFMQRVLKETNGTARFRVCDTLGIGVPDPYAPLPWGIPRLIATLRRETGAELEFHGQEDFGLGVPNAIMAWRYGAKKANCTFAGIGERSGNVSLERTLAGLIRYYGDPGFNLHAFEEMRQLIHTEVTPLSDRLPLIGEVFTTAAGIHQTGIARQREAPGGLIYLPYEPATWGRQEVVLNRIGALSGLDGILDILNDQAAKHGVKVHFGPTSKVALRIYDFIQEQYNGEWDEGEGRYKNYRTTFFSPAEIWELAVQFGAVAEAPVTR